MLSATAKIAVKRTTDHEAHDLVLIGCDVTKVPRTSPSRSTVMRSLIRNISFILCVM